MRKRFKLSEEGIMARERRQQGKRKWNRRGGFDFSDKVHSQKGMASVVMAISAFIGYIGLIAASSIEKGKSGVGIGAAGAVTVLILLIGVVIGVLGLFEEESKNTYPVIGVVSNLVLLGIGISIYIVGMVR